MKATISELWETGRQIISFDDSDTERPQTFSDLKKCENVLIGDKLEWCTGREVFIDNDIFIVTPNICHHPYGGRMYILEIL